MCIFYFTVINCKLARFSESSFLWALYFIIRDIPRQLTPFSAFFFQPSPISLKFGMFVGLDDKMSHTKFQVSKSNSF